MVPVSTNNRISVAGDGTEDVFDTDFTVYETSHLEVYLDGVLQTSGFAVALFANGTYSSIAKVTFTTAPASGVLVLLVRNVPFSQNKDYANNAVLDVENIERSLDILTFQTQQLNTEVNRSLTFSDTLSGDTGFETTASAATTITENKAARINKGLMFDADGDVTVTDEDPNEQITLATAQAVLAAGSAGTSAADVVLTHADVVLTNADVVLTNADVVSAEADKVQTGLDRIATAADVVLTNADVVLTNADVVLTNADELLTRADTVATAADKLATNADVVLTNADVVLAEADKVQTGLDRVATAADKAATNADVVLTAADVVLAEADKVQTGLDRVATAADVVLTNADVVLTNADVVLAEADKVQTGLDRVATAADKVATNADVVLTTADELLTRADTVLTAADVVTTAASATAAAASQAAASTSAANAASSYDSFDDRYLGTFTTAAEPTVDNDTNPLVIGALYFNTTSGSMMVYDGAAWIAATSAGTTSMTVHKFTASGSETQVLTGSFSPALSYTVNNIIVFLNGVKLDATDFTADNDPSGSIESLAALAASDELVVVAFKSFTVADMVSASTGGTFSGDVTFSGDAISATDTKFKQKGAFLQSSTHQALFLGA